MATTSKQTAKSNLHAPVSNQPKEAATVVGKPVSRPPSEGIDPKTVKPGAGGAEPVAGFKLRKEAAAEMDAVYRAPDDTALRRHRRGFVRTAAAAGGDGARSRRPGPDHDDIGLSVAGPRVAADHRGRQLAVDRHRVVHRAAHARRPPATWCTSRTAASRAATAGSSSIQVMPGRNGASLPYGSVTSTNFRSVTGWTNRGGDENYDYGAIIMPTQLGNTTGWFGFGVYSDADLLGTVGNISGYPGDKPAGTQWYDAPSHRFGQLAQGVLRHRHGGRAERQRGLPHHQRQPLRRSRFTPTGARRPTRGPASSRRSTTTWSPGRRDSAMIDRP